MNQGRPGTEEYWNHLAHGSALDEFRKRLGSEAVTLGKRLTESDASQLAEELRTECHPDSSAESVLQNLLNPDSATPSQS